MWLKFAASTVALTFYLFASGCILLRGLRLPRQIGISCAPLIGVFVSVALGIAYAGFGITLEQSELLAFERQRVLEHLWRSTALTFDGSIGRGV